MPRTGLEPACLSTHAPETCASTNSATWAQKYTPLLTRYVKEWSGKRDSDPRPQPWQGCALPTELFPLVQLQEVKRRRLELPRHNCHYPLKVARLPIPPPLRSQKLRIQNRISIVSKCRAENGTRTRDPNLGKVVLYQLSYFRLFPNFHRSVPLNASAKVLHFFEPTKFFSVFFIKNAHFSSF